MSCFINLGCDFSPKHIDAVLKLVEEQKEKNYPHKITDIYGSPRELNPFGSVRPSARETGILFSQFEEHISLLKKAGIIVNLTFNSLFPHIKSRGLSSNLLNFPIAKENLLVLVKTLKGLADNWIVAHPLVMEILHREVSREDAPTIIVSTIMNVHTLAQLDWIKTNWPLVNRVCPALEKGRDFHWLKEANAILPLELLANEFCNIGGSACEGLYRQACYLSQSVDSAYWNPMLSCCIQERREHPEAWLMAKFILPQWLKLYREKTGIVHYKVTGRTHDASFIEKVGRFYASGKSMGNLLELWGPLQAALDRGHWQEKHDKAISEVRLDIKLVERMIHNFDGDMCNHENCGHSCDFCKKYFDAYLDPESFEDKDIGDNGDVHSE